MDSIYTLGTNIGRKIAQTKLPTIPRWGNEAYAGEYDRPVPFYRMMVVENPNSFLGSAAYVMGAPITMTSDAIATVRTVPKILYNFGTDLLNAGISRHNYNSLMGSIDEDTKRKIQRRGMGQIGRDPNAQASPVGRAIPRMERVTKYAAQPVTYLGPSTAPMMVDATAAEPATYLGADALANQMANASAQALAKTKIVNALGKMANSGSLASKNGVAKARALIDLYKKLK